MYLVVSHLTGTPSAADYRATVRTEPEAIAAAFRLMREVKPEKGCIIPISRQDPYEWGVLDVADPGVYMRKPGHLVAHIVVARQ